MIGWLIVADEVAFWVLILAGLVARYLLRRERLSQAFFLAVPLLEVVLVVATAVDLHRGTPPNWTHGLAAVYLGFSVGFGPRLIEWADERFAHRFAGGPPPTKPASSPSWARVAYEWREWSRMVVAGGIASVLLLVMIWYVDDATQSRELWGWIHKMGLVTVVWLLGWPVWESVKNLTAGSTADHPGGSR